MTAKRSSASQMRRVSIGDLRLSQRAKSYVHEVLESNRLSHGPFSERFESSFARLHDCRHAIFTNSGTGALHIALSALKEKHSWKDGDEVLVPSITFIATPNIVLHNRMQPVFVDVQADTYNMDPARIEEKITPKTRAILPVHLMGLPCDMDPILEIARKHGLLVLEDSCETMFAQYRGRPVGSMGAIACFSTYAAHYIVTGVGGFASTSDPELALLLRSLMNHGRDAIYLNIDDDQNVSKDKLFEIVARRFSFLRLGHSFRATEMEAAIGLAQLEERGEIIRKRQAHAHFWIENMKDLQAHIQLPRIPEDRDHMFMFFPLLLRKTPKEPLLRFLEENGIETRDLMPLLNQPIYRKLFGDIEGKFPVAESIRKGGFFIGCHQHLTQEDLSYVAEKFHEFFLG